MLLIKKILRKIFFKTLILDISGMNNVSSTPSNSDIISPKTNLVSAVDYNYSAV